MSDFALDLSTHNARPRGMGSHESHRAGTHVWLTPRWILDALGPFDLDPCAAPAPRPWPTASTHWGEGDNSLNRTWTGRVWLNPPYGNHVRSWLARMADHNRGCALIFARTETVMFFDHVWPRARAILFLEGRVIFHHPDGGLPARIQGGGQAGAPSVIVAYGDEDAEILRNSGLRGKFLPLKATQA